VTSVQKIRTFLWFDDQAEEAANFYVSLFDDSRVTGVSRYTEVGPGEAGSVMVVTFELAGREFLALNGGPEYSFTEAISLMVDCRDQSEVDRLWDALTEEGEPGPCGWLKDCYGLSWQIVPRRFFELVEDDDSVKTNRVMQAMLKMSKMNVAELEAASKRS
jgi:predicted 3-demethylubiquinone-9 3-methyltransferase (glyoxalase superfamily)